MSRQRNTAISCRTLKGSARVSIPAFRFLHGLPMCNTEYNANVPFASAAFDTCDRESPLHPHSLSAATRLFLPFLLRYRRFFPPTPMHAYLYRPAVHAGSFHCLSLQGSKPQPRIIAALPISSRTRSDAANICTSIGKSIQKVSSLFHTFFKYRYPSFSSCAASSIPEIL